MAENENSTKRPMVVQGAGIAAVNGTYERCGTLCGAPQYSKLGPWKGKLENFCLYRCSMRNGRKQWYISIAPNDEPGTDEDIDFYFAAGTDSDVLPPKNDWAADVEGVKPAPRVVILPRISPKPRAAAAPLAPPSANQNVVTPQNSPRQASETSRKPPSRISPSQAPPKPVAVPQASPSQKAVATSQTFSSSPTPGQTVTKQEENDENNEKEDEITEENEMAKEDEITEEEIELENDALEEGDFGADSDADREYCGERDDGTDGDSDGDESSSDSQKEAMSKPRNRNLKSYQRSSLVRDLKPSLEGYECWREFMDNLVEEGVDKYVDLPMIAVMGDTSSGKSSLLSNISFVELPSSDTLTTRCPIRLQMRRAESRRASVKVAWKDAPEGAGDGARFEERTAGEENWGDIASMIAEAQKHILDKSGKEVARDTVCVDVRGPRFENLTLVDLPGIVRSAGRGEGATLARDVRALMDDYLGNERCVVLAVHSCNVDFHNSQILADARRVDPGTERTIPVLTKPDLIDPGAESGVEELLQGKKTESFAMGFHMVKGRSQKDLNEGLSIEDGLAKEEAFFRNNEPWRNTKGKSKFGTKYLRVKLAGLQMNLIRSSFKSITSEMKENRDNAALELRALGEIPFDLAEKRALFRRVREQIWNGLGAETLDGRIGSLRDDGNSMRPSAKFHLASKRFQDELSSSKLANVSRVEVGTKVVAIIDGHEVRDEVCYIDEDSGSIYIKKRAILEKDCEAHYTWMKKQPGHVIHTKSGRVVIKRKNGNYDELEPIDRKLVHSDPQWISELIKQNRPYSLPIFLNQDVFNAIVADRIEKEWSQPSMDLLDFTADLMETAAEEFIEGLDSIQSLPSLASYLIEKSSEVVESIKGDTRREIEKLICREQRPYTQDHFLFENVSKLRSERLMDEVLSTLGAHVGTGATMQQVSPDSLHSAVRSVFKRNQQKSVDEHMAEEMQNALDGYGKVAFKRFVDNVPMICIGILQKFPGKMNEILFEVTDDEIEQLVAAPSDVMARMNELKGEVKTLEKGISTIKGLTRGGINVS